MATQVRNKTGRIASLRVHEKGSGYGPPNDQLDAEVIVRFENDGALAYGLPLRNDDDLPAAQAMFALLQDAFDGGIAVSIDYREESGRNHHYLFRVWRSA